MFTFIVRRLIQIPVVMFVLSVMIVGLLQLLSPAQRASGYIRSEQQAAHLDQIIRDKGFDQPFPVQYGKWLGSALHGDLGFSKTSSAPVLETIAQRLPATLELAILAAIPIILIGVWFGTLSALHKDRPIDQIMRVFTVLGYSLPTFVLGILFLKFLYGTLGWAPGPGQLDTINQFTILDPSFKRYTGMLTVDGLLNGKPAVTLDVLRHLILPVLTLTIVSSANIIKIMRAQMLEALTSDFVRTARSKGLPERVVTGKHARRNALLPVVTLSGFTLIGLLGGSIITETIFAYPGVGQWAAGAAGNFDVPAVIGFALASAVIVVLISTATDILYGVVDPRVRFD
ncbi:ABC transporter permease [Deinococcus sp. KNUC1210]|uniref:ABC transporter permease n=1 Tax=Deinococcus sp. KNUC1210 TaxID=2917691 RepID=UPI001EF0D5AA|nr:ABC transporter permease [Deinococcus sp. KNUC1210]ULH14972.1 ABC transporter permease [Deinococcus sp. KNUC1210]